MGRARRRRARNRFKPQRIRCLLIAEAPPSDDRYFYFAEATAYDGLFREVMRVLFQRLFADYDRSPQRKLQLLKTFQKKGLWLLDSIDQPLIHAPRGTKARARYIKRRSRLLPRLQHLLKERQIQRSTPMILITASVHEALFEKLTGLGFTVLPTGKPIPFPNRHQRKFRRRFPRALRVAGVAPISPR